MNKNALLILLFILTISIFLYVDRTSAVTPKIINLSKTQAAGQRLAVGEGGAKIPNTNLSDLDPDIPRDVFFLLDTTFTFKDDIATLKSVTPELFAGLEAAYGDMRYGLGRFEDYPIIPFGLDSAGDEAYRRIVNLNADPVFIVSAIRNLEVRSGLDEPESQLVALYQVATGIGQDLDAVGFPNANIIPGQQADFRDGSLNMIILWTDAPFHRPGDDGAIDYPGPGLSQTAFALSRECDCKVIGILSQRDPEASGAAEVANREARLDLRRIARATGATAPAGGVDCDADGTPDIGEGEPLVCSLPSGGAGIEIAVPALISAVGPPKLLHLPTLFSQ